MKIDYTNFLRDKPLETDQKKIGEMERAAMSALRNQDICNAIPSFECYADGCVKVSVYGKYFNMFNTKTGKFFSGAPGDDPSRA